MDLILVQRLGGKTEWGSCGSQILPLVRLRLRRCRYEVVAVFFPIEENGVSLIINASWLASAIIYLFVF